MSTMHRALLAPVVAALSLTLAGAAIAGPSASIEQVRNGLATSPTTPVPSWVSGNAGASNSHYLESHSIAYRTVMGDLPTDGTVIELIVGYNVKRSGSYAIDYLTNYQRLLPHVGFSHSVAEVLDPLNGVAGVGATVSTAPIPLPAVNLTIDPDGAESEPAAAQPATSMGLLSAVERTMTLYGGNLIDVSYVTEGDVSLGTSSSETQVRVRFTASSPTAVLAWGGHIACRWDWGFNPDGSPRSAGGISGSSYHMRLVNWNLGNLGNQDRSLSTDAVFPVPRCGVSNLGPFCATTTNTHTAPSGMESYHWTLFDNTAGAVIVGSAEGPSVTVSTANAGSYSLLLTTGASGFTKECQATVTVVAPPTVHAGADQLLCATSPQVQLAGQSSGGGTVTWSGGAGTFSPSASALNAAYTPTASEVTAGSVTLTLTGSAVGTTCPPSTDQVTISFQRTPLANAGANLTVCATSALVQLAGSVSGSATGGVWSGGAGTFSPSASALNATYSPTAGEIVAGSVSLTLTTTTSGGPCPQGTDQVGIAILPAPTANAGADQAVCSTSPQVQLAGSVAGSASGGAWTGGNGTFSPGRSALNATYTPSAAEVAAGTVTLTLTTTTSGPCPQGSDQVTILIQATPTANAGVDPFVCATSPQVQLAGSVSGSATGGAWTGGNGSFNPGRSALNATYTPTAAEIAAGSVTLTLTTTTSGGPCPQGSDQVTISILPAAFANAGADRTVCSTSPQVQLTGLVAGGASNGLWSGGGGSFSPNASHLDATYTPSPAEIAAGTVTLTLTTNDPAGPCGAVSDQVRITIVPAAIADAGADLYSCSSAPRVQLAGSVGGSASGGTWSGGTGTFSPGNLALNASYTPSPAEVAAGSVTLTLTATIASGPCPPVADQVTIFIQPAATVNAGPDQSACAATLTGGIQLAGTFGGAATGVTWSGGAGTFSPSASDLNPIYTPSAAELAGSSVTLTLTTNDPLGPCPAVTDQVKLTFVRPVVTVADRVVCSGMTNGRLCANASGGVSPYTYLWSNGVTTQCMAVADTGRYTVTITDALGCQATGSGAFRFRDCQGMLAHTNVTCQTFMDGTGDPLYGDVSWVVKDNIITSIAPGVFFYYTKVTAPRANFAVQIQQTKDNDSFPFIEVQQAQISLYDQDCQRGTLGENSGDGQASVQITGATPGQVFIISVKYSLKSLVGTYMDETMGCHYDFKTLIDGMVVDQDPEGLQIGLGKPEEIAGDGMDGEGAGDTGEHERQSGVEKPTGAGGGIPPAGGQDTTFVDRPRTGSDSRSTPDSLNTYSGTPAPTWDPGHLERPTPNPFSAAMRMAYDVGTSSQRVTIGVYDVAGRLVRTLENGVQPAGRHDVHWDGRDAQGARVRKGMYFVHVRIGNQAKQVRVTLLQ